MYIDKVDYDKQPPLIKKMLDVRRVDAQIARYRESIRQIETQMHKCTSRLTGMPRGGNAIAWADLIAEKDELKTEIEKKRLERLKLAQLVALDPDCDRLSLDEYRILCMRYMSGYSLAETAFELNLGKTTVYDIERKSLTKIRTNPNESERIRTK